MRWAGHLASMGEKMCLHGFGGKPEGKRPTVRPRHGWEDNIAMDFQVGWEEGLD